MIFGRLNTQKNVGLDLAAFETILYNQVKKFISLLIILSCVSWLEI